MYLYPRQSLSYSIRLSHVMVFEKPAGDDSPDVHIKRDVTGVYEIASEEVKSHDEVTPEGQFPTMGDKFLPVLRIRQDRSTEDQVSFIAFYTDIQRELAEIDAEEGDRVRIRVSGKNDNDVWEATVSYL